MEHIKAHLKGKVVILGIGNTLRNDDGLGSILAKRLKNKVPYIVYDSGANPENYLGKIIRDKPDNIVIIDAVDFGGKPGEFKVLEGQDIETVNFFSTHDASISLAINYLQSSFKVDIIILSIQPKSVDFGEEISPEVLKTITELEQWFDGMQKKE
ncbi:MAG: hydrogenase 3 maturation endopeptidase HyCI [Candidatus Omnitrophota bacterium]